MKRLGAVSIVAVGLLSCAHKTVRLPLPPGLIEATRSFDPPAGIDKDQFEEDAQLPALGPQFNNRSCVDCHFIPATGGGSGLFEHRIAPDDPQDQVAIGALIHDASVDPAQQQHAPPDAINALRRSVSIFGDGLVEQVPDSELQAIAKMNGGQWIKVPVLEAGGQSCVGRFGWKDQHCSLFSFAGDADFNEKGVGNTLVPDPQNGIEDFDNPPTEDILHYANFMRALNAPPRGTITPHVTRGGVIFERIGCASCHVESMYTRHDAPAPLADRLFHPFGDFLLHDIGTGDGIPQAGAPANKLRTAPLWGLRVTPRLLHDGRAFDLPTAILAHRGEASVVTKRYKGLSQADKADLLAFLLSL